LKVTEQIPDLSCRVIQGGGIHKYKGD